jgi:hypothetical protein
MALSIMEKISFFYRFVGVVLGIVMMIGQTGVASLYDCRGLEWAIRQNS